MTVGTALRRTGAVAGGFDPSRITWLAAYWASDPLWSNPGDGNTVSSWRDYSGNTRDVTQGTGGLQPIYRASHASFNSNPVVDFDVNDNLVSAAFTYTTGPVTLLSIGRTSSTAANRFTIGDSASNTNVLEQNRTAPGGKASLYGGAFLDSSVPMDTNAHLVYGYVNGTSSYIVTDSVKTTGTNGGITTWGTSKALQLAGNLLGQLAFAGLYAGDIEAAANWATFKAGITTTYGITL